MNKKRCYCSVMENVIDSVSPTYFLFTGNENGEEAKSESVEVYSSFIFVFTLDHLISD